MSSPDTSQGQATASPAGPDLAARLTGYVATAVELIRDKSVRPAFLVASGVVVTLGVLGSAIAALVLVAVGLARLFEALVFSGRMWATDSLVGGIFAVAGLFLIALGNRMTRSES
jgi:hypothetical protein